MGERRGRSIRSKRDRKKSRKVTNCDHARRNNRIMGESEDYTGAREGHSYTFLDLIFFIAERRCGASFSRRTTDAAPRRLTVPPYISRRDIVLHDDERAPGIHIARERTNTRICSSHDAGGYVRSFAIYLRLSFCAFRLSTFISGAQVLCSCSVTMIMVSNGIVSRECEFNLTQRIHFG